VSGDEAYVALIEGVSGTQAPERLVVLVDWEADAYPSVPSPSTVATPSISATAAGGSP
jgi:hypothetical protein